MKVNAAVSKSTPGRVSVPPLFYQRAPSSTMLVGALRMERGQANLEADRPGPGASMNCADVKGLFPDLLNRRLSPFQSVLFQEHCAACATCRSEWRLYAASALPAARAGRSARLWPQLGNLIFKPVAIKLPLEAAGLLLVVSLALYAAHRLPGYHPALKQSVAVLRPTVSEAPVEPLSEITPEPQAPEPDAAKSEREIFSRDKPQSAPSRSAQTRAAQIPAKRFVERPPPDGGAGEGSVSVADDEQFATAQARGSDADRGTKTAPSISEVPAEVLPNDKSGTESEESGAVGYPSFVPEDPSYFFLYNPSMKPL